MATYRQNGKTIDFINSGSAAIAYGEVVNLATRVGVAAENIAIGDTGSVNVEGVFEEVCITAAINPGTLVYWDTGNKNITNVSAGNIPAGWCIEPKPLNQTTIRFKLLG